MKNTIILAAATSLLLLGTSNVAFSADKDGCFSTSNYCVKMSSKWRGKQFTSYYTNNCAGRIYIKFCNKRSNGKHDCGASGLRQGKRTAWTTYGGANGQYAAKWIGSHKGGKDWVCAGKVRSWRD